MSSDIPKLHKTAWKKQVGIIIGLLFGFYCGSNVLIPIAGYLLSMLLLKKLVSGNANKLLIPAIAIHVGYLLWFLVGMFVSRAFAQIGFDVIVILTGIIWLIVSPGKTAVIILTIYHSIGILLNVSNLLSIGLSNPAHKALLTHLGIRIIAITLLWTAISNLRKATIISNEETVLEQKPA